jgi:hypothetical protein
MAAAPRRVLIAGESWIMHTIHQKGLDAFTTTAYGTGHQWLQGALEAGGWEVEHLPNHLAPEAFPTTMVELISGQTRCSSRPIPSSARSPRRTGWRCCATGLPPVAG